MKELIIVRHAKSSWKDSKLDDHDRPLNKRGERDAPFMAKIFRKKKMPPDLIISSTAVRANSTAKAFAKELGYKKDNIILEGELYLAELDGLIQYIRQLSDDHKTVMLFGHNPGITWLANYLSNATIENVPTCGICAITFEVNSWNEVAEGKGNLKFFEFPKMYFKDSED